MAKIFVLSDKAVLNIRKKHPALKGKKLIASGQFSGVFESDNPNTVLKLSIDDMSYKFLLGESATQSDSLVKVVKDYGIVGEFVTSKNISPSLVSNPISTTVPIFLYEVERLQKLDTKGENRRVVNRLCKRFRELNAYSFIDNQAERFVMCLVDLSSDDLVSDKPEMADAFVLLAEFINQNPDSFADLHTGNFMQREDGTVVISDPIGSTVIFNNHNTFSPILENAA
ncbi:hypothetical protein ACFODO_14190 [Acinetobacter sichuanensis]|uniref:Uncharacterized protein n=1 Tax=Acinetobacter sichuanensis TaxID=2136183 RepID=A0A371YNR9_9GAMM|nr:hypothetical protein [Acinetobacter sichuanensis]RFC83004.1 hypothetical protein C9E89_013425 [Acinetobacter sichuanensis]